MHACMGSLALWQHTCHPHKMYMHAKPQLQLISVLQANVLHSTVICICSAAHKELIDNSSFVYCCRLRWRPDTCASLIRDDKALSALQPLHWMLHQWLAARLHHESSEGLKEDYRRLRAPILIRSKTHRCTELRGSTMGPSRRALAVSLTSAMVVSTLGDSLRLGSGLALVAR